MTPNKDVGKKLAESLILPCEPIHTKWVVVSGGPSSGKTSLLGAIEKRGYSVLTESADEILRAELLAGNQPHEVKTRGDFSQRIAKRECELMTGAEPQKLLFFDTSLIDHFVYDRFYNRTTEPMMERLAQLIRFATILHLEQNPLHENSEIRTESKTESDRIGSEMKQEYLNWGYQPINVPFMSPVEKRADFALELIRKTLSV